MYDGGGVTILGFIKILAMVQFLALVLLVALIFVFKGMADSKRASNQRREAILKNILKAYPDVRKSDLKILKSDMQTTFLVFGCFENIEKQSQVVTDIFLPNLKIFATSSRWFERYMASVIFQWVDEEVLLNVENENLLIKLIDDSVALVAVNAAIAVCYHPSPSLLNPMIAVFAQLRRSQLELMVTVLKHGHLKLTNLIVTRLETEKDPYIRAFCYRLLIDLPKVSIHTPSLELDIQQDVVNLALAALSYLSYLKKPGYKKMLVHMMSHSRWEIRARCIKYLGQTKDVKMVAIIRPYLKDASWWVRFRSAEALDNLGEAGKKCLEEESLSLDQFASDMSRARMDASVYKKGPL